MNGTEVSHRWVSETQSLETLRLISGWLWPFIPFTLTKEKPAGIAIDIGLNYYDRVNTDDVTESNFSKQLMSLWVDWYWEESESTSANLWTVKGASCSNLFNSVKSSSFRWSKVCSTNPKNPFSAKDFFSTLQNNEFSSSKYHFMTSIHGKEDCYRLWYRIV
jgi:hypothetical protein